MTGPLWLLLSRYVRPLPDVDALRADHVRHLERHREEGSFLGWGRLVPPAGGFVLARGVDRATLDAIIGEDPFTVGGVAEWEVHELSLTGGTAALLDALAPSG